MDVDFRLGSDPELMLVDAGGNLKSAIPIVAEGKGAGRPLDDTAENTVLHDNVLVEFNTKPADTEEEFVATIGSVLKGVGKLVKGEDLSLLLKAAADYPEAELQHPEAQEFGCEPDFCAYKLLMNEVPAEAAAKPFRSAGGHLHIGKGEDEELNAILDDPMGKISVVKAVDAFCVLTETFLDRRPESASRRELYGRAGSHRPKDYGVECRALSNWWLASPQHTQLVHQLTAAALEVVMEGRLGEVIEALGGEENLQEVINKAQVKEARKLYKKVIAPQLNNKTKKLVTSLARKRKFDLQKSWGL